MVELASADRPDVLCLQEIPVWALPRIDNWSGMRSFGAVTRPPLWLGPVSTWVTRAHQGLFRSGLAGQANAILVASQHAASDLGHEKISLTGASGARPGRPPRRRRRRRREPPRLERLPRPVGAAGEVDRARASSSRARSRATRSSSQATSTSARRSLDGYSSGGRGHRPRARAGCPREARGALGARAPNGRRRRALRPPSGRARSRSTT